MTENNQTPKENAPSNMEKAIGVIFAFLVFALIAYTIVGGVKIEKEKLPLLYVMISLMAGVFVSTIPGFLNVDYSGKGMTLRAAGGAAAFILVFASLQEMQTPASADKKNTAPASTASTKTPTFKATSYCSMTNVFGFGFHKNVTLAQQMAIQNCTNRGGIPNCCANNVRVEQVQN